MTLKVVGAGVGRTGSNSLKIALEQLLAAPCHHMFEITRHLCTEEVTGRALGAENVQRHIVPVLRQGSEF